MPPWHFLYFLPLPQGQGSFRPTFLLAGAAVTVAVPPPPPPDAAATCVVAPRPHDAGQNRKFARRLAKRHEQTRQVLAHPVRQLRPAATAGLALRHGRAQGFHDDLRIALAERPDVGQPDLGFHILAHGPLQALQEFGLSALQAHMFIFYFAILSMVTPPIALSAYAAAGISGASMWSTGIQAFKLTFAGFLIPYALAYNPALLLEGSPWDSLWVFATSVAGVACLAGSVIGHMLIRTGPVVRLALFAGSILLIVPELVTDAIGMSILVAVLGGQFIQQRRLLAAGQDP